MLLQFAVSNFLSFHHQQIFTSSITSYKEHPDSLYTLKNQQYSKVSIMFGPNASGKSNFIKALQFVKSMIERSNTMLEGNAIPVIPFQMKTDTLSEFEFLIEIDGIKYNYGFSADAHHIEEEFLYYYPKQKETLVFKRTHTNDYEFTSFKKELQDIAYKNTKNKLFLVTSANWNFETSKPVVDWFLYHMTILNQPINDMHHIFYRMYSDHTFYEFVLSMLKAADIQITSMQLIPETLTSSQITMPSPLKFQVLSMHEFIDTNQQLKYFQIPFAYESSGTQALLLLADVIYDCIKYNHTLIIDEIDKSLHPLLVEFIIKLFTKHKEHHGQIIFNTHDVNLLNLDLFRRDQIWFIEKNKDSSSELYNLSEFGVRKTDNILRSYLLGRYGAIPLTKEEFDKWEEWENMHIQNEKTRKES